jgi:hypothetical protein
MATGIFVALVHWQVPLATILVMVFLLDKNPQSPWQSP